MNVVGRDRHCSDCFFMPFVTDVDDLVALACPHFHFVMNLGYEGADSVDDISTIGLGGGHNFRSRPVCRQHDGTALRNLRDVVDEHHSEILETLDNPLVVNDLVIAVNRRFERANHPSEGFDRHLDSGTESSGSSQKNLVYRRGGQRVRWHRRLVVHGTTGYRH